ncbi:conjugal transfer protein TraR [Photobacterium sanctipauli]|uniref:Conjugal transfer protein TraR n=1 Tax=Photobacterium sanctipauli TaxID=1342794 RepID=A0A2T3NRE7_9GAMM|nr:TraR/DksA C4-type zinc finger protein [Photobacterium sanctipauli]PSW18797.1 conjugal transfer protein TraR [Photobacterium sanctipauli]
MATSDISFDQLKQRLEQEHGLLAKELKHEMLLNTLVPSATAIESAELGELMLMAKSSFIPNLFDLAIRMEKVDAAVCSIKLGMYGFCVDCEDEIELADLQDDPAQPRCKSCRVHSRYHHNA